MARRGTSRKTVVASERLESEVNELMALARERGRASRRERWSEEVEQHHERDPATQEILNDELRQLLEDEVVPAYPDTVEVLRDEIHREVAKKALVGLHVATLKRVAEDHLIDKRGTAEDIAGRIARRYGYDETQIAQLILDNEDEPKPERGHVSRLFPMGQDVSVAKAIDRLRPVVGRLIRTGVARWFEVDELSEDGDGEHAMVEGRLRTYKAFVDELGERPTLGSSPTEKAVAVVLVNGRATLMANGADATVSRIATRGVASVTELPFATGMPLGRPNTGRLGTFDERTVMLLDLVYSRLDDIGITDRNLTVARFVTEKGDQQEVRPEEAGEHSLKAVRFEGHHLLDSPQACQLIALHGRGLVDISLWVAASQLADDGDHAPWFPMRFTLERDHIAVLTGFGRHQHELSLRLHRQLTEQAERALSDGPLDAQGLEELGERIYEIARTGAPGSGTLRRAGSAE